MNFNETRKITERGTNMKRTYLIAVLVGIVAVGIFAADASAMYHPGMGVFMQRDPGAGGAMRIGAGGPAVAGGFIPRDPMGQYADGMSLYQYVLSNPLLYVDPLGLAGREAEMTSKYIVYLEWWAEQGVGEIKVMLAQTRQELIRYRYDRAAGTITPVLVHGGRQLPGIASSAMKKIGPHLLKHMKHVVEMAGGRFTPQVARTAAGASGASGGGLGRAISRFFGSALIVLAVLDMTASTASAPEIPRPDLYTEISLENIGVTEQDFVEQETPGKVGTKATGNKVETTAEIRQCPTGFKAYTFESGDTCWCMWQKRTNKGIAWKRAHEECDHTANSGNADRIQAGETICVPE